MGRKISSLLFTLAAGFSLAHGQAVVVPITATPAALTFTYQIGAAAMPAAQTVSIKTNPVGLTYSIAITGGAPTNGAWVSTSLRPGVSVKAPGSIAVTVTPTGLSAGTYTATLTVTAVNGATSPFLDIPITLAVSPPAATLRFSPAVLTAFDYTTGGGTPSAKQFIVYTDGNPVSVTITVAGAPWLKANPTGTVRLVGLFTPITLSIDPTELAKLAPKTYNATVTVAAPAATNKSTAYPVILNVKAAVPVVTSTWPASVSLVPSTAAASVVNVLGSNFFDTSTVSVTGVTASATITLADSGALQSTEIVSIPVYPTTTSYLRLAFGTPLPAATVGSPYTVALGPSAKGGSGVYVWSATGLPSGLTIDMATGTITGVPLSAGTSYPVISATDADTLTKASLTAKLPVYAGAPAAGTVRITVPALLPDAVVGTPYSGTLAASGGTPPYVWSVATAAPLPAGLVISAGGTPASISGTPTTEGPTGKLTVKKVNDAVLQTTVPATYLVAPGILRFLVNTPVPGGGDSAEGLLPVVGPDPQIQAVVNSASYSAASISPGQMVTLFGANLGPTVLSVFDPNPTDMPLALPGAPAPSTSVDVTAGGTTYSAAIIYANASQIGFVVPFEVAGAATAQIVVTYGALTSQPYTVNVSASNPGIFTSDGTGGGQGAILNYNATTQDYAINAAATPALKGSTIVAYVTGFGTTNPVSHSTKRVIYGATPVTSATVPTVTIGGKSAATVAAVPDGSVPGLLQLNIVVPDDAPVGKTVPIVATFGGVATQSTVTVSIK